MAELKQIDGVEIHIEGQGAETIVMIHGWPDTYRLWDGTVAALQDRYRCVRFTLPGFDPAHEQRARTLPELMAFFQQVIEQTAPGQKVILMLHDWGCVFGYQFYARHPERVSRIVGVDIGDALSMRREATVSTLFAVLTYQWTLAFAWKIGGEAGARITRWMARRLRCPADPATIHAGMDYPYYMLWFGGPGTFRGLIRPFEPEVPLLYLYAKWKPFMFHAESWVARLQQRPGNRVESFDTGHWIMLSQQRERFHKVVRDWLTAGG